MQSSQIWVPLHNGILCLGTFWDSLFLHINYRALYEFEMIQNTVTNFLFTWKPKQNASFNFLSTNP